MASRQIGLVGAVALLVVGYVWIAAAPSSDVMDTSRDPQPTAPRPRRPAAMHPNAQAATQADAGFDAAEDAFSAFYVPPRFPQSGPDRVRCGDSMCLKRQERCCAGDEGTFCLTLGKPCPLYSNEYECDESDDCPPSEVCCVVGRTAQCTPGPCVPERRKLCSQDDECASGTCLLGARCRTAIAGSVKFPELPPKAASSGSELRAPR